MEFNQKLQELRKQKGITQFELAKSLYVSRTAISKWESGRGYPNIESLREIAKFFNISVDELLSGNQLLAVAENDKKQTKNLFRSLLYGLLDITVALLFFLPFFALRGEAEIKSVSLINLNGIQSYAKILFFVFTIANVLFGVLTLALQNCTLKFWTKYKTLFSLLLTTSLIVLFILCLQPYASIFSFVLLIIKALTLIKF